MTADKTQVETPAPVPEPPVQSKSALERAFDRAFERVMSIGIVRFGMSVMDTAGQAGAPLFSAALAFTTLFALFPLLLLMGGILGWLIEDAAQREALLAQLVSFFPPIEELLSDSLDTIVNQRGTLTVIGLVGLVWGASSYYAALDEVLRRLFTGGAVRDFVVQRIRGIITVVVLIALMMATLVLSSVLAFVSGVTGKDDFLRILSPLGALAALVAVVLAIYLVVPAAPPSWRAALPPAVAAGIGIGALTNLFGLLAPWLIGGFLAFGVIASVFAALVWLNLSYQILLFGAAWARLRRDAEVRRGDAILGATPYAD